MIGKAERGAAATQSIKKHQASYLIAVGGAAYLISKSIKKAKKIAFISILKEVINEKNNTYSGGFIFFKCKCSHLFRI
jgi:fumarate hydratase class I